MRNKANRLQHSRKVRWSGLGFSVMLAIGLAFILLFIPLKVKTVSILVPEQALPAVLTGRAGQTLDLDFSFGVALVHATNGLTITKSTAPVVDQGDVLTYTLNVTNETGEDITDGRITDTIPTGTTCSLIVSPPTPPNPFWTNSCGTMASWTLVYAPFIPDLSTPFRDNTTNVFTYSIVVNGPLPDQFELINNDYSISAEGSIDYFDAGPPVTTIVNAPNWAITKTVSSETIQPGEFLTYTITVVNDGHLATSGVYTVTDPLPDHTVPGSVSIQAPGFLDGITVTWVLSDTLAPLDGTQTLTYAVQVTTPLTNGETIVNENYSVTGGNVFSPAIGAPVTVTVASSATLVITKTASPDPVQAGDLLTYTITVTNDPASQGPAFGVTISDLLPDEVIYQSAGFVSPASGTITDTGNPIVWSLDDPIGVGDSAEVTVTVRVGTPLLPGPITNTFAATAANALPISATITTEVTATNEITLAKSVDPTIVAPGDTVTYTVTLTNSGNSIATVDLSDFLGDGFSPTTIDLSDIEIPGRTLAATEGVTTVVFAATAPITPGLYFNQVVTATYDLTQTVIAEIAPVQVVSAALTITKIPNLTIATIGDTITYTYQITNSGDITLTDIGLEDDPLGPITILTTTLAPTESTTGTVTTVVIEDDLPGPITNTAVVTATFLDDNLITATTTASVEITFTAAITLEKEFTTSAGIPARIGDTITYTYLITNTGAVTLYTVSLFDDKLGPLTVPGTPLAPGDATTVTNATTVIANDLPGPLTNMATVTGTGIITSITAVATDTASVPLSYTVAITIEKTADPTSATVGDVISYTYLITNTGQVTLTDIILFDDELGTFPPVSTTLAPDQSATAVAVKLINQGDLPGPIVNTATVTGTDIFSAETVVATDTATVMLTSTAAISLEKQVNVSVATIDQQITYTYLITNQGNVNLTDITLDDDKVGLVASGLSLLPGSSTVVNADYVISEGDFPSPLVNTAVVTAVNFAGAVISDTAIATVTLTLTPGITLAKTANVSVATPGQTITYTYHITNSGNVTLTEIILTDDRLGAVSPSATTLGPGGSTTGTADYTVQLTDFPQIVNTAVVTGEDIVGTPVTDTATLSLDVAEPLTVITVTNSSPTIVNSTTFFTVTTNITGGINYTWNFADGTPPAALGPTPSHVYTAVGTYTVVVTASGPINAITGTTTVVITPGPADHFVLSANSPQIAGNPFTVTITAVDAFGNQVTDFNEPADLTDDTGTIVPLSVNLVNGTATANVTVFAATSPALDIITATNGPISGTVGVEIRPDDPDSLSLSMTPSTLRVCETAIVTATMADQWGNRTPGHLVNLAVNPGTPLPGAGIIFPPVSGLTNGNGIFTATLRGNSPGNINVIGVNTAFSLSDLLPATVIAPALPSAITVTVTPPSVIINNSATVSAQVTNCFGAPVSGSVVTFTIASLGNISPATATTDASGVATTTVTAGAIPGVTTITGTIEGPLADSTPFTITALPVMTITKTANPAGGNVETGNTVIYQLVVSNNESAPVNNVVITDVLDSGVSFVGGSITPVGSGPFGSNVITFSVPSLAPNQSVTATIEVTVTATVSGTVITNSATASSNETGNIGASNMTTHQVITRPIRSIFMPLVLNNFAPPLPDLTITSFSINPPNPSATDNIVVTVVVENQGNTATGEGFWLDFYVNPATLPSNPSLGADRRWDNPAIRSIHRGIGWEVPALAPGETVTLTSNGSGGGIPPSTEQTVWPGPLPGGNYNLYSFVDSYDNNDPTGSTYVEVVESNENNNLAGPITISISGGQTTATADIEEQAKLPPRPDIGR